MNPAPNPALVLSRRGNFKTGCLIALGVMLLIVGGLGIWIAYSWRDWFAGAMNSATVAVVDQSQLPTEQKDRVKASISKLGDDFKGGKVSMEQLGQAMKAVTEGPLMPMLAVWGFEEAHLARSGLTKEEKDGGTRALQRYARGIAEKKIKAQHAQSMIDSISTATPTGGTQMKQKLTDDEVKKFLAAVKAEADRAAVPDEAFTVNVADEIDKALNQAMTPAK